MHAYSVTVVESRIKIHGLETFLRNLTLLKMIDFHVPFPKIDGFEGLPQEIDGFSRTHRIHAEATTAVTCTVLSKIVSRES